MVSASLGKNCLQNTSCLVLLLLVQLNGGNGEMEWEESEERRQWSILGGKFNAWRLSVETNNARDWETIPPNYKSHVARYMTRGQYMSDSRAVIDEAINYVNALTVDSNAKDAWILDVDDTALSTIPYWRNHLWGAEPYNSAAMSAWAMEGKAPALPTTLELYEKLIAKGIKVFFISGRSKSEKEWKATRANLERVGYKGYKELILRGNKDYGLTMVEYATKKRKELVSDGFRILGNVGDQWSEITGNFTGQRTFKLPNPMYYIA
eukprot:Gb_19056 [translate_table: standard]